jgi:hypothetical protein
MVARDDWRSQRTCAVTPIRNSASSRRKTACKTGASRDATNDANEDIEVGSRFRPRHYFFCCPLVTSCAFL